MPGPTDDMGSEVDQHDQMLSGVVQIGRVKDKEAGDPQPPKGPPMVLVQIGGDENGTFTRTWMPWLAQRAGYDADWWMPDFEEQVLVGRIPDFPVTRSHPLASWPSAANSSIGRTYRKTVGEESLQRSPVASR